MPLTSSTSIQTATIANGDTVSAAVQITYQSILGIQMPAAFTGTVLTFQVSSDGSTYVPMYDALNVLYSITVAASRGYSIDPAAFAAWPYVKIVSGAAEAAARTIVLMVRPV